MIEYQLEESLEIIDELKDYVFTHAAETDIYQEYFKLDPNFTIYYSMQQAGVLKVFTAREEGEIIGYTLFIVEYNPHYKDKLYAVNDLLYVVPDKRHTGIMEELFSFAEEQLIKLGVQVITFHMKTNLPFEKLANRMGYDKAEIMYSKYIGDV